MVGAAPTRPTQNEKGDVSGNKFHFFVKFAAPWSNGSRREAFNLEKGVRFPQASLFHTIRCLDRVGKVPGWKPEVARKDEQVRILQAALIRRSRSTGGAPALKAGNRTRHAGSNPVCGAFHKICRLGGEATRRFRKPRPPVRTRRFDPFRRRFVLPT